MKYKKKYIPPKIEVIMVEMECGISAGSGTTLPASNNTPVTESWDNSDVSPDAPVYW